MRMRSHSFLFVWLVWFQVLSSLARIFIMGAAESSTATAAHQQDVSAPRTTSTAEKEENGAAATTAAAAQRHILEGIHLPFEKHMHLQPVHHHLHHAPHHHHHQHNSTRTNNAPDDANNNNTAGTNTMPEQEPEEPTLLRFNGAGVRSVNFFYMDIKVYVAGFYTNAAHPPLTNADAVFAAAAAVATVQPPAPPSQHHQQQHSHNHYPMLFDFTFLRNVNQNKVTEAWQTQLGHSVEHNYTQYDGYEQDRDAFVQCFGPIQTGGTESVLLLRDGRTIVVDQGVPKGVIANPQFQQAFLSVWFGNKAVAPDLKLGLLGNIGHFGLQPSSHHHSVGQTVGLEGA